MTTQTQKGRRNHASASGIKGVADEMAQGVETRLSRLTRMTRLVGT